MLPQADAVGEVPMLVRSEGLSHDVREVLAGRYLGER